MNESSSNRIFIIPIVVGLALAAGIYIGTTISPAPKISSDNKLNSILDYIQQEYVDTINREKLTNETIVKLLEQLDPHSAYIPKEELQAANEPLEGNFEGIGIEFHIQEDTIMVVSAISGGPSESLGIKPGDRIVKVDSSLVAGVGIKNEMVMKTLRGTGGSIVNVSIFRRGQNKLIDYKIVRGRIPINSLEFTYMITPQTGYIKISRFSATTYDEFILAMQRLKKEGLRNLVLDLRGNPGGFLDAATAISDEFIGGKKLIVYTQGKSRPKTQYFTAHDGLFEQGQLIILIDEGSASAAEIVSGAIQDWDRGTIVGRRSFGKGLVQEQTLLPDGSAIRLTIARYYTPTGRSIQKPYNHGFSEYEDELYERMKNGELLNQDSIHLTDTVIYKTPSGKTVYGGGGITPDVFVPLDTLYNSEHINRLFASGSVNQFAYDYVDQNRTTLMKYESAAEFKEKFKADAAFINEFISYAEKKGVVKNDKDLQKSLPLLQVQLKAYIARLIWKNEGMYPILHERDVTLQKALQLLK